jgi:hypothetical protein
LTELSWPSQSLSSSTPSTLSLTKEPFFLVIALVRRFWQILFGFSFLDLETKEGRQPYSQPPTRRIRFLYLCPPVTGWFSYASRHRVPFSSPWATRRAAVEVFQTASRDGLHKTKMTFKQEQIASDVTQPQRHCMYRQMC